MKQKMNRRKRFDDESDGGYDYKGRRRTHARDRGRDPSRRRPRPGDIEALAELMAPAEEAPAPIPAQTQRRGQPQARPQQAPAPGGWRPPFRPDPAYTVEARGLTIDLSRTERVSATEAVYRGRPSHGIRFDFAGGKGRDAWYGSDLASRDADLARFSALLGQAAGAKGRGGRR